MRRVDADLRVESEAGLDFQHHSLELWGGILARPDGEILFFMLPMIAGLLAIRDGCADAWQSRSHYARSNRIRGEARRPRRSEIVLAAVRVLLLALLLATLWQLLIIRVPPDREFTIGAAAFALFPYVVLRGPASRIARDLRERQEGRRLLSSKARAR